MLKILKIYSMVLRKESNIVSLALHDSALRNVHAGRNFRVFYVKPIVNKNNFHWKIDDPKSSIV